jgi:hypothetical protein
MNWYNSVCYESKTGDIRPDFDLDITSRKSFNHMKKNVFIAPMMDWTDQI